METEYQTEEVEAVPSTSYEDVTWIRWGKEGRAHEAAFRGEVLQYVNARLDTTSTTLASTIDCFGKPPLYRARMFSGFEGRRVEMEIWYPEQGIEVGFAPNERQADRVHLRTTYPAFAINYLPTNTLDDGFNTLHQFLFESTRTEWYEQIKPYPDDIEAVEVTLEP